MILAFHFHPKRNRVAMRINQKNALDVEQIKIDVKKEFANQFAVGFYLPLLGNVSQGAR